MIEVDQIFDKTFADNIEFLQGQLGVAQLILPQAVVENILHHLPDVGF